MKLQANIYYLFFFHSGDCLETLAIKELLLGMLWLGKDSVMNRATVNSNWTKKNKNQKNPIYILDILER